MARLYAPQTAPTSHAHPRSAKPTFFLWPRVRGLPLQPQRDPDCEYSGTSYSHSRLEVPPPEPGKYGLIQG